ncbi:hypothetical protein [Paraglaciecola aestuariivivens]
MPKIKFPEHGEYQIQRQQDIILIRASGAWNLETSKKIMEEMKGLIDELKKKPFALIIDTHNLEGITSESYETLTEGLNYWVANGFSALARLDDANSPNYKVYVDSFDAELKKHMPYRFADSMEQGIAWLNSLGFKGF